MRNHLGLLPLLIALCSCSQNEWQDLLDKDLSHWRIYQSYAITDDFVPYQKPCDADGNEMEPIGYDVNLDNEFSVIELEGEKVLHVSGKYYGCVFTKKDYGNYHLKLKYKFGEDRFPPRLNKAPDSGLLYHSHGECGVDGWLSWMSSHELQLIEGGTMDGNPGDYWAIEGNGAEIKATGRSFGGFGRYRYDTRADLVRLGEKGSGGVCAVNADYGNKADEWTEVELICYEDKAIHIVNGEVVLRTENSCFWDGSRYIPLHKGKIQLQSEAAEVYFKDVLIRQIDEIPAEYAEPLPRTIVTTDGEVDDYDSFVRLLMYANEMDIEGIVYSSSQHHWAGDGKGTLLVPQNRVTRPGMPSRFAPQPKESHRWIGTSWIQELIDKYELVYDNLVKHDSNYPTADYLRSVLKVGNIVVEGDMAEPTEGSELIKDIILDDDPSPVYMQIWGGTNTVARALLSIEEEYKESEDWDEIYKKVSDKVVIHIIQDQDGTYRNYVSKAWPEIPVVYNRIQFFSFAYLWTSSVPEALQQYLSGSWFVENINEGHGPLAGAYLGRGSGYDLNDPDDNWGDPEEAKRQGRQIHEFISEGDSPSFFLLHDWGLRSLGHPEWGGLGGRFYKASDDSEVYMDPQMAGGFSWGRRPDSEKQESEKIRFDRKIGDYNPYSDEADMWYPQTRWIKVLQNDFASRADWCVSDYKSANHRPAVAVNEGLNLIASPGETIVLTASANDPDGDDVAFSWWQYREAGTSDVELSMKADGAELSFEIPEDAVPGTTLHVILEAADNGSPELTSFQRVIITIK